MIYNPGDVSFSNVIVTSSRGSNDFSQLVISGDVWESIENNGIVASIRIYDADDLIGEMKLSGDETVSFDFSIPEGGSGSYTFHLNGVKDVTSEGMKYKIYELECVSKEVVSAKSGYVNKQYMTQTSSMVQDIFNTFLKSNKSLDIESSLGSIKYIVNNLKPFAAIDKIRRMSASGQNKSGSFLFFENQDGYAFKTIEGMMSQSPMKTYTQSDALGSISFPDLSDQLLSFKINKQGSTVERVGMGGLSQTVNKYDMRTQKYTTSTTQPSSGNMNSSSLKSEFGSSPGRISSIPFDSRTPDTKIAETTPDQLSYMSNVTQVSVNATVIGNPDLRAGKTVALQIPKRVALSVDPGFEEMVNGTFLISRLRHQFREAGKKPRYICQMELITDRYANGV